MSDILVDANVIVGLYKEDVLGMDPERQNITGSPLALFERIINNNDVIFLDDRGDQEGMIENEWRRHIPNVGQEWFENWYFTLLHNGNVELVEIDVASAQGLLRLLHQNRFPRDSGDKWYVRIATTIIARKYNVRQLQRGVILTHIVSEDIDFFEPAQKNHATGEVRLGYLRRCDGEIPNILRNHGIQLSCIENY